jgi:uncharacterized RmlC-like cupin family protein
MIVPVPFLTIALVLTPILQADPPGVVVWNSSELERRNAALSTGVGPVGNRSSRETLADYGNPSGAHRFRFIRRESDGMDAHPEIHDEIEDVVFIQSGEATLLVGGEMINRRGDGGDGIEGAVRYPVAAGDIIHIPAATPHGYLVPEGGHVTYVLVRVPAFAGEVVVSADTRPIQDDPPGFAMWDSSELEQRNAALSPGVGPVGNRSSRETLADYGNPTGGHRFRLIRRESDGMDAHPEIHGGVPGSNGIIDVVFVKSGRGTLLAGGETINRMGDGGDGIAGAVAYPVVAGDMIHIPAATPHGYLVPQDGHITYVLVRVPALEGRN